MEEQTKNEELIFNAKSSVKLVKNTKGVNWEIKVVEGEEGLMESLKDSALNIHKALEDDFGGYNE